MARPDRAGKRMFSRNRRMKEMSIASVPCALFARGRYAISTEYLLRPQIAIIIIYHCAAAANMGKPNVGEGASALIPVR
jgi:hypothetical protein